MVIQTAQIPCTTNRSVIFYVATPAVHPKITGPPTNSTVTTPMMAQFICNATGVPRPTIEWYYEYATSDSRILTHNVNNVMIDEVPSGERSLHSTLTLTTTTHPDDSGNYTCRAVNIADEYFSSASLNVLCKLIVNSDTINKSD